MRVALALEYAGHAFCGFQSQPTGCGVQDTLTRALGEIADHPVRIVAAGRTDAGVHAASQIVHFDTEAVRPETAWVRGVNAHLPPTASVLWARPVADEFHARFAAIARHYSYLLLTRPQRPGLFAPYVGWYHAPLDIGAMREGAKYLAGTHDFSSFRAAECQAKSPIKTLTLVTIEQQQALVRFEFTANAFLHHMIRNIVGALVSVGMGKHPPAWLADLLSARDRARAPATFAATGLYFAGADYDLRFALPPTVRRVMFPLV
ncbi:MAG: tRNA pseudouridine(38-40) synthase TruA [Betaproteobacteria bacterium]|nr:tRNA pseudouridine(38-40) synthase TruA [Betaproteobacteria bacterium]